MIEEKNKFRIVLAAPDNEARYRLKNLLERDNNIVVEFDSTSSLLDHLQSLSQPEETQLINLLIVHWLLSDKVLKQLVRHLQQPPFSNIPLVALTDSPCIEIKEAMMFLKHTDVLQKPVKSNDLLAILNKFSHHSLTSQTGSFQVSHDDEQPDYYTLLESNSLLELAIKNHHNTLEGGNYSESHYGESGIDYLVKDNLN